MVTNTGNPRGQGIYIPTEDGCIQKSTLLSQYPNAIGLKYSSSDGRWFSVTSNKDGGFLVPEGIDTVVVTCKAAGTTYFNIYVYICRTCGHLTLFVCVLYVMCLAMLYFF